MLLAMYKSQGQNVLVSYLVLVHSCLIVVGAQEVNTAGKEAVQPLPAAHLSVCSSLPAAQMPAPGTFWVRRQGKPTGCWGSLTQYQVEAEACGGGVWGWVWG